MKKLFFILLGVLLFLSTIDAATNTTKKNQSTRPTIKTVQQKRNLILGNFTKGSIVDGTKGTGSVRRWYLFNEGSVGSSYTILGKSQYVSVDLGYSTYIRTIESLLGGMNFIVGTEITVPIYLMTKGRSNILDDHRFLEREETKGVAGFGVQLPLIMGLEYKGFYILGLGGYTWLFMKDTYYNAGQGENPTVSTQYDGIIYGGGLGYKISNVVNIGLRYVRGNMTNRLNQTNFDAQAIAEGLEDNSITKARGRDLYNVNYERFYAFISYVF
ncbi:hypothetical protein [Helicobacter sp. 13S00477-4]|uniref:hypothetical protein n=1 Tax=Helicobacter sp. 13S00477-4 TaxID=1905759 RepID=UPI000BA754B0|nr:hypothetical protein [Helicobacter sp. 13S00477-4]PAF51029.1 hypothetical protein BKH44_06435 [Helicobacter sp. 13S00477-4]